MDDRDKKKVVLIKGDNTKCYEQAIFILKPDIPQNKIPINFVAEAEKIINNCFHKTLFKRNINTAISVSKPHKVQNNSRPYKRNKAKVKKNNALNTILNILIVLLVILFSIIFYGIFNETLI